jgi:hypothetical protein
MLWRRLSKVRTGGVQVAGLRDERKALAVRYTIDAAEAQKREEMAVEAAAPELADVFVADGVTAETEPVTPDRGPVSADRDPVSPQDPGASRYIIELRPTGFLWRWAVFDLDVGGAGTASPLPLRSLHAVTVGGLPRLSERSARRAAERAAREAYAFGEGQAGVDEALQLQH